jgi:hypothetical protein
MSPISGMTRPGGGGNSNEFAFRNYKSTLPEVYSGHPNRVERYNQYEAMDMDSEINACLDIISEFSTQVNEQNSTAFEIDYKEEPTDNESKILNQQLKQWVKLNQFDKRIFKIFRNTIKYGDQVFVRDPETFELFWVEMNKVSRVIVNESKGKEPEQYIIKDINPNFENLTVAAKTTTDFQTQPPGGGYTAPYSYTLPNQTQGNEGRFHRGPSEAAIDAQHVVHLSLTEGLDFFWPFGQSVLEYIFKVYKQKELLEDAILIYRVQRAPERRVFYIDVGNMPAHMAMGFVERVKNEIHQRRIPTQNGGGQNMLDASYNPLSINEDYFFPQTAEGRGSKVETLPGGENLGQIDDLRFFNNKLARGLRVPSSYLPTGPDDQTATTNDGRLGTALIQEFRFNQYCERLQNNIITKLNEEFKMFLKWRGFNIDSGIFDLKFNVPQNFASYRQSELDSARLGNFSNIADIPYMSKRFALKRFLGLTEDEIIENEKLWREENNKQEETEPSGADMRGVGVGPGDFDADLETADNLDAELEMGDEELGLDAEMGAGAPGSETEPEA